MNDFELIKQIVKESWKGIKLVDFKIDYFNNSRINCFFNEKGFEREISWAGQGLQIWFQIISHLVRLKNTSILILDEPEVNLHPEKQHDLIKIINQYFGGSVIIATHSVELMNNVDISHIIHVKKAQRKPKLKLSTDKKYLESIRSNIGSNFNFITSQFEEVDLIIFTEDVDDYKYITRIAKHLNFNKNTFNIPLHGFSEYKKAKYYKEAYQKLIGKNVDCCMVLDRDYYPDNYLDKINKELKNQQIKLVFTIGKEIENMFLDPKLIRNVFNNSEYPLLEKLNDKLYNETVFIEAKSNLNKLYTDFYQGNLDPKTLYKIHITKLSKNLNSTNERHLHIPGKDALAKLRSFYRLNKKSNLSDSKLINTIVAYNPKHLSNFIGEIYS